MSRRRFGQCPRCHVPYRINTTRVLADRRVRYFECPRCLTTVRTDEVEVEHGTPRTADSIPAAGDDGHAEHELH